MEKHGLIKRLQIKYNGPTYTFLRPYKHNGKWGFLIAMIFIDESFKDIYVMGAVVGTRQDVEETIRITRGYIKKYNKTNKKKIKLPEIKDSEIHRYFPKLKKMVLENLVWVKNKRRKNLREDVRIFAVYILKEDAEHLTEPEIYKKLALKLLQLILSIYDDKEININFDIYFDQYGEKVFIDSLYEEIKMSFSDKKLNLTHVSSTQDKAIQTADVVTGTVRRYLLGEDRESLKVFAQNLHIIKHIK